MSEHATQLHFEPMGQGRVGLFAMRGETARLDGPMVERKLLEILAYPQQGQMIGSAPVDVKNAMRLNAAVEDLNGALAELAG